MRSYSELKKLKTFKERFEYLKLDGSVGSETFGYDRYLNQVFYRSDPWKKARDIVITRDNGCDLGIEGYDIFDKAIVHHMNPVTAEDIENRNPDLLNPEFLITVSFNTHNAITYGSEDILVMEPTERFPGDTKLW